MKTKKTDSVRSSYIENVLRIERGSAHALFVVVSVAATIDEGDGTLQYTAHASAWAGTSGPQYRQCHGSSM